MTKEKEFKRIKKQNKNTICNHSSGILELSVIDTKNDRIYYVTTCKKCGYELNINY